jgi:hypothetical protein
MNIEILRNTLYKAYLDDFARFVRRLGGATAEVMGDMLSFEVRGGGVCARARARVCVCVCVSARVCAAPSMHADFGGGSRCHGLPTFPTTLPTSDHSPPCPRPHLPPLHLPSPPQADRRALNITLNSIGTELTRDDRRKLYSNFGLLYPHGLNELAGAEDFDQIRVAMEKCPPYQAIFTRVGGRASRRRQQSYREMWSEGHVGMHQSGNMNGFESKQGLDLSLGLHFSPYPIPPPYTPAARNGRGPVVGQDHVRGGRATSQVCVRAAVPLRGFLCLHAPQVSCAAGGPVFTPAHLHGPVFPSTHLHGLGGQKRNPPRSERKDAGRVDGGQLSQSRLHGGACREQEIRNLMWISECVVQDQRNRIMDGIVMTF